MADDEGDDPVVAEVCQVIIGDRNALVTLEGYHLRQNLCIHPQVDVYLAQTLANNLYLFQVLLVLLKHNESFRIHLIFDMSKGLSTLSIIFERKLY